MSNYIVKNMGNRRYPHVITALGVEWKFCSACFTFKPLNEFHKNPNTWDKLTSRCKACQNAYQTYCRRKIAGTRPMTEMHPTMAQLQALARKTFGDEFFFIDTRRDVNE